MKLGGSRSGWETNLKRDLNLYQDIPVEEWRYGTRTHSNVTSLGVLEVSTEVQHEEQEEMFMTPPETLSRYGFTLKNKYI